MATRSSNDLFNTLPPELRLMVEDYTFSAGPTTQHITPTYEPPTTLGVSKATRQKFAQSHYTNTAFTTSNQAVLRKWLLKLPKEHLGLIQDVHVHIDYLPDETTSYASATGSTNAENGQTRPRRGDPKARRVAKKQARKEQAKRNNDPDFSSHKRAEARKFFVLSYLRKRGIKFGPEVVKVKVKYEGLGMGEGVWTSKPEGLFKEMKRLRRLEEQ